MRANRFLDHRSLAVHGGEALAVAARHVWQMLDDAARSGSVSPAEMFRLQTLMTTASQYLEAASNVMSTMHQAVMSLARAVKGQ